LHIRRGVLIPAFCPAVQRDAAGRDCRAKEFSMIHFVKHPHLRLVEILLRQQSRSSLSA
jgi:hypothetical protein